MLTPGDVSVLVRLVRLQGIEVPTAIIRKPAHGQPSKPDARRPCGFSAA
jgi:methyl coenzyme M reductase subunit D